MNYQETFDKVVAHLMAQGCQALNEGSDEYCRYRGENGTKCAVGALITDGAYTEELENKIVRDDPVIDALKASGVFKRATPKAVEFLSDLQVIHDSNFAEEWPEELQIFADNNNLELKL